jgi:hypothetical protein
MPLEPVANEYLWVYKAAVRIALAAEASAQHKV